MPETNAILDTESKIQKKLGFLGVGWIGKSRLEAIKTANIFTIGAIADANQALLADMQEEYKVEGSNSLEDLLLSDIDGLVIATPSAMHAKQSIMALENGKAVFCQKPLGRNATETKQVVDTAKRENLLLGVDFSYRFTCYREIYKLIQSGALGKIYAVEASFHNAYGPDKSWFYDPQQSGGGCLIDLGIHLVDLILWSFHFPKLLHSNSRLFSQGNLLTNRDHQVEDYVNTQLYFENEMMCNLTCSWNLPAGKDADISINVFGTKGGASFRNLNGSFYDFEAVRFNGTQTQTLFNGPDDWGGKAAIDWCKSLDQNSGFDESAYEIVEVAHLIDKIYADTFDSI